MSQRQARVSRKTATNGAEPPELPVDSNIIGETPEDVSLTEPSTLQLPPHPCILVVRIPGEQEGQWVVESVPLNGMDVMSVPTVLKIAAKIKEAQLGIGKEG